MSIHYIDFLANFKVERGSEMRGLNLKGKSKEKSLKG